MKRLLGLVVFAYACVIIGLLWYYRDSFLHMNLFFIGGAVMVMAVAHFLFVFSWRYMLSWCGVCLSYSRAFRYQCLEDACMFLPAKANYLTLPFLLRKFHKWSFSRGAAFKLVVVALELLSVITLILLQWLVVLLFFMLVLVLFYFAEPVSRFIGRFFTLPQKSLARFLDFRFLTTGYLLLFLFWFFEGTSLYLILLAFQSELSLLTAVAVHGVSTIAGAVSLIPGGMGVREGTIAYVLHLNQLSFTLGIPIAILGQIITVFLPVFFSYVYSRISSFPVSQAT
ncbi:MAG: lysylphosphatidylglycerol synthase domain-containing protein [Nanobdellota archaeon]